MRRKRWSELTQRQQVAIAVAAVVQVLLSAATLWDLRRRPSTQVRGSKTLWSRLFVNFVGPDRLLHLRPPYPAAMTDLVTGAPGRLRPLPATGPLRAGHSTLPGAARPRE